jgi:hypothetical protein
MASDPELDVERGFIDSRAHPLLALFEASVAASGKQGGQ